MGAQRVRIGFIGGGMMCQVGHLPFYLEDDRVEVVGVAEERPSLQAALAERLGRDRVYPDRAGLLAEPRLEALVICSPRPATGPLTLEALSAGKHVLVEKPIAHSVEQARRLVETAEERGLHFAVGFMKLHDPGVVAARRWITQTAGSESTGRLLSARFFNHSKSYSVPPPSHTRPRESRTERYPTWPLHPPWLPARHHEMYAWFLNSASHDVNLLRHLLPAVGEVRAATSLDAGAVSALLHAGDIPVSLDVSKAEAGRWVEGAELSFERARLTLSIPSPMAVDQVAVATVDVLGGGGVGQVLDTGTGWSFARQARAYVDLLTGTGANLASGDSALADMELTESIWRAVAGP